MRRIKAAKMLCDEAKTAFPLCCFQNSRCTSFLTTPVEDMTHFAKRNLQNTEKINKNEIVEEFWKSFVEHVQKVKARGHAQRSWKSLPMTFDIQCFYFAFHVGSWTLWIFNCVFVDFWYFRKFHKKFSNFLNSFTI